jgi:hypothetical protein
VDSYEFQLLEQNGTFSNVSDILVHHLRIFDENFTLKFKNVENIDGLIGPLMENADVWKLECYWSWATPNTSAVLNNCNNEMVSVYSFDSTSC